MKTLYLNIFFFLILFSSFLFVNSSNVEEHYFKGSFSTITLEKSKTNNIIGNVTFQFSRVNSSYVLSYVFDVENIDGTKVMGSSIRLEGPAAPGNSSTDVRIVLNIANATKTGNEFHGSGYTSFSPVSKEAGSFNTLIPNMINNVSTKQFYIVIQPTDESEPVTRAQLQYINSVTNHNGGGDQQPPPTNQPGAANTLQSNNIFVFIAITLMIFLFTQS